jgi:hypothetical protein
MTQKRASNGIFSNLRMIGVGGDFWEKWSVGVGALPRSRDDLSDQTDLSGGAERRGMKPWRCHGSLLERLWRVLVSRKT